ncbi:hypothetical protein SEA_SANSA_7 [Microbacterium phage Sansa]|uniref:Uncharacterized protein n=1 Tax=Microbacterium phage Sansa TaxID=2250298 RepID=A0A345KZX8_9CAUD|nr:hypothetical protein SEA_SANSA_7 [Microbacterium phage Sansa]
MAAIDDLNALLANLPGFSLISESMKLAALEGARVPDSFGIWPGEQGYESTYDVYFAAISLIGFLKAQPFITNTNSEGTGVTIQAPDWSALLIYYSSQSTIVQAAGNGVLTKVNIPDTPHVQKVPMNYGGDQYGDLDTDMG